MGVTPCFFCHIPPIRSKSQVLTTLDNKTESLQGYEQEGGIMGTTSKSFHRANRITAIVFGWGALRIAFLSLLFKYILQSCYTFYNLTYFNLSAAELAIYSLTCSVIPFTTTIYPWTCLFFNLALLDNITIVLFSVSFIAKIHYFCYNSLLAFFWDSLGKWPLFIISYPGRWFFLGHLQPIACLVPKQTEGQGWQSQ